MSPTDPPNDSSTDAPADLDPRTERRADGTLTYEGRRWPTRACSSMSRPS
jgi:hypothetical protein